MPSPFEDWPDALGFLVTAENGSKALFFQFNRISKHQPVMNTKRSIADEIIDLCLNLAQTFQVLARMNAGAIGMESATCCAVQTSSMTASTTAATSASSSAQNGAF